MDTLSLPSYYEYQKSVSAPAATAPIALAVADAVLSTENAVRTPYQEENAIRLAPNGYAEWTVTIPADATYSILPRYAAEKGIGQTLELSLMVDGKHPFREAAGLELKRLWRTPTRSGRTVKATIWCLSRWN